MIEDRLTQQIEAGAKAKPRFSTEVIKTDGGWEVRNSRWQYPLHQFEFDILPGYVDDATDILDPVIDLFYAAGGAADTFRFKHWADYQGVLEAIGTGDSATTVFQIYKNYTRGAITRQRKITRPVTDTVQVYLNAMEQMSGWTADYDTGEITFTSPPTSGDAITATYEFDVPVRFADDELEIVAHTSDLQQPVSVVLLEVKE